jgi:mono/diheme cytochrome c family protein
MIRKFVILFGAVSMCVVLMCGFRGSRFSEPPLQLVPDMKHQPKVITQHPGLMFSDGRGDRSLIEGTVPLGYTVSGRYNQPQVANIRGASTFSSSNEYRDTGLIGRFYGSGIPIAPTQDLLLRGRERYGIYCSVCHGDSGKGDGIAKRFGLLTVATLQDSRLREQPDGMIFETITNGRNTMGAYGPVLSVEDRWAIVAYVRALQVSEGVPADVLGEDIKNNLRK